MTDKKKVLRSLRFLTNGETLLALVFLAAGIFVLREGILKLKAFWIQFAPLFPFSIPGYADQKLLMSLPQVINILINVVSSLCAVLIGLLWSISGLAEIFQSLKFTGGNTKWQNPSVVAETLQTGRPQNWKSFVWLVRPMAAWWPRLRAASPISYEFGGVLLRSACKIVFTGIVIGLIFYFLRVAPSLIQQQFQIDIRFFVPSPRPLYFLLGFMLLVYALTALSLFPFRTPRFERTSQTLVVRGKGDSHLFFAILEEGCKLLTIRKSPLGPSSTRLEREGEPSEKGTLIESNPEQFRSWANPAAYCYLPVVFMLLIMGFTRLMHFSRATGLMPHTEFFRYYFVDYLLEVAFAIGLIVVGTRLAEMARKLFRVQRYRSALVFCHVTSGTSPDGNVEGVGSDPENRSEKHGVSTWKGVEATDDQFARWVKDPAQITAFHATLCWGEALSTSARPDGPRYLTDLRISAALDSAMQRILQIPFNVDFDSDLPAAAGDELEQVSKKHP